MEKRYTAKVPASLTQRLYEVGMPLKVNTDYEVNKFTNKVDKKIDIEPPSYAKTFDWLASKGFIVTVYQTSFLYKVAENSWDYDTEFDIRIYNEHTHESECPDPMHDSFKTWHEAADYGIEKAIEML